MLQSSMSNALSSANSNPSFLAAAKLAWVGVSPAPKCPSTTLLFLAWRQALPCRCMARRHRQREQKDRSGRSDGHEAVLFDADADFRTDNRNTDHERSDNGSVIRCVQDLERAGERAVTATGAVDDTGGTPVFSCMFLAIIPVRMSSKSPGGQGTMNCTGPSG